MGIFMISFHFWGCFCFWCYLHFWGCLPFEVNFVFKVVFISISNLVYSSHITYPSSLILWGIKTTRKLWTTLSWLMYGLCTLRAEWGIGNCIAKMRNWRFNYRIQMLMHFQGRVRNWQFYYQTRIEKYQSSSERGTRSPPAMPYRLLNPKWPPGGHKMAEGVWKGVQS